MCANIACVPTLHCTKKALHRFRTPHPLQVVEIVCCKMTPLQLALYCHFLESKVGRGVP